MHNVFRAVFSHHQNAEVAGEYGREAIRDMMKVFFAGGTCVDLEVMYLAVDGNVVLMERRDHWTVDGQQMSWPVMGSYTVTDGKITAWREYFYKPAEG